MLVPNCRVLRRAQDRAEVVSTVNDKRRVSSKPVRQVYVRF